MGYEISAKDLSEFTKTGQVSFVDFITSDQIQILKHGQSVRDSFLHCPLTKKIFTKRDLGKLLFEMIEKKPIRLVFSKKITKQQTLILEDIAIDEIYIGMFLSFKDGSVLFYNKDVEPEFEDDGIVVAFGEARARYLPKEEDKENSYLLKMGYAAGDKLKTKDFPLVYK